MIQKNGSGETGKIKNNRASFIDFPTTMIQRQHFVNETFKLVAILENTGDFIFSQVGLTVKTYAILYLISTGINTSKDLLNGLYGSKPNMAKKLKMLEDNGFIQRTIDKKDKRVFRFTPTKKAQQSIKKVGPIYEKNIAMIFDGIKNKELEIGFEVITRCLENLKKKQEQIEHKE